MFLAQICSKSKEAHRVRTSEKRQNLGPWAFGYLTLLMEHWRALYPDEDWSYVEAPLRLIFVTLIMDIEL